MLAHLLFCRGPGALLTSSFEIPCSIFDIHSMSILCLESRVLISVKIGKNSARNQSKTLIPQSKNQIFWKFLTALLTSSYENPESRIEDYFRIKSAGSSNYRGATFLASGNKKTNSKLVLSEVEWILNKYWKSSIINRKIGVKTSKII